MIKCLAISKRSSVRLYDRNKKVSMEDILSCIEAANSAPSAENKQPWRFRIISERKQIEEVATRLARNQWIKYAPVIIIVGSRKSEGIDSKKTYLSIGAAIENMVLEAQERGISSCWIGECLGKDVESLLTWPKDYEIVSIIVLGYKREYQTKRALKKNIYEVLI